eukprot:GFKZ01002207.1.p1 GENE.GFKZ01002207.1~~GFKZ01002207.1.p1  ORF type:complete len:343 (+),score=37.22 GFKZ01002207.1:298-1326(+)
MQSPELFEHFSAWADLGSLVLLVLSLYVGGLNPSRPVWGRSNFRNAVLFCLHSLSIAYSGFRFIGEAVFLSPGPREFLAGSLVYLARWLWLSWRMNRPSSPESRLFEVALSLRELHTMRIGFSTDKSDSAKRAGDCELVIRRGARKPPRGQHYWRGVKETPDTYHEQVSTWEVRLVEEGLHADKLDIFGTAEYMDLDQASMEMAYKRIYEVVMRALPFHSPESNEGSAARVTGWGSVSMPSRTADRGVNNGYIDVNFEPFFEKWSGLPVEWHAKNVGADDERPIGCVARRVAADAVVYVNKRGSATSRTREQVRVINRCLECAARGFLIGDSRIEEIALDLG